MNIVLKLTIMKDIPVPKPIFSLPIILTSLAIASCASSTYSRSLMPFSALKSVAETSSCEQPGFAKHEIEAEGEELSARDRAGKIWAMGYGFEGRRHIRGLQESEYAALASQPCEDYKIYSYRVTAGNESEVYELFIKHETYIGLPLEEKRLNRHHQNSYVTANGAVGKFVNLEDTKPEKGSLTGSYFISYRADRPVIVAGGPSNHSKPKSYETLNDCVSDIRTTYASFTETDTSRANGAMGVCIFENYPKTLTKFIVFSDKLKRSQSVYER